MKKLIRPLLFWSLILCACSSNLSIRPTETLTTPTRTPSPTQQIETPSPEPYCSYQQAYHDISSQFQQDVTALIPGALVSAATRGENCLDQDGHVQKFLPLETDFYILILVTTPDDYETLGNQIAQVMEFVAALPADQTPGPKPGFVEFLFDKLFSGSLTVRVPIQQYKDSANGITGEELFRMFYTEP